MLIRLEYLVTEIVMLIHLELILKNDVIQLGILNVLNFTIGF